MSFGRVQPVMLTALPAILVSIGTAQPDALVIPLDPRAVFDDVRSAYTETVWAERVTVVVHLEGGTERAGEYLIRVDPQPDGSLRALHLEIGPLFISADAQQTLLIHSHDDGFVFKAPPIVDDPVDGIRGLLPPIAIPHLEILAGDMPFADDDGPAEQVYWMSAELSDETGLPLVTVTGQTESGIAVLIVDAESGRLRSFTAPIPADTPTRIEIRFRPLSPGDPQGWGVDTEGREVVTSLAELAMHRNGPSPDAGDDQDPEPADPTGSN